jgi:type IV secretion system protein VirD4
MAPSATARWASPGEIAQFRYEPGSIFLGAISRAADGARPSLERSVQLEEALLQATDLNAEWLQEKVAVLRQLQASLQSTESVSIGIADDRHMLTVAGSRAGKGVSAIIPNLTLWPGSVLAIDPKGELASLTAARRGQGSEYCRGIGQEVGVLDPYGVSDVDPSLIKTWNPMDELEPGDPGLVDKVGSIASALVIQTGGADSAHFDETARAFIEGLILYVVMNYGPTDRSLLTVHRLLMEGSRELWREYAEGYRQAGGEADIAVSPMEILLSSMAQEERLDGAISGPGAMLLDMSDRERGSVLSTARRNLDWLKKPAMRRAVERSTIDLSALKSAARGQTIYCCLPPERMEDCGRWLRLVISAALEHCYATLERPRTGHSVLFVLDEFPVLGHLKIIETAAGYAAGYGVKLWCVVQDFTQLKRNYKESWETFVGNAGVIQAFANSDATTTEYLSKLMGQVEVSQMVTSTNVSLGASTNDPGAVNRFSMFTQGRGALSMVVNPVLAMMDGKSTGESATTTTASNQQIVRTSLMLPDEIRRTFRREAMAQLVLVAGRDPMFMDRLAYHEAPDFLGLYEPPPAQRREALVLRDAMRAQTAAFDAQQEAAYGAIAHMDDFINRTIREVEAARASMKPKRP